MFNYNGHSHDGGIYVIFNKVKWRLYVGSCAGFQKRWWQHVQALRKHRHENRFLQSDYTLCGEDAFEFHVLEALPTSSRDERLVREQYWIDIHYDSGKQCYNLRKEAVSREGSKAKNPSKKRKPLSEEHKHAISKSLQGRQITLGHKLTEEHKMKISKGLIGRKVSTETREKLRESNVGQSRSVEAKENMRLAALRRWAK